MLQSSRFNKFMRCRTEIYFLTRVHESGVVVQETCCVGCTANGVDSSGKLSRGDQVMGCIAGNKTQCTCFSCHNRLICILGGFFTFFFIIIYEILQLQFGDMNVVLFVNAIEIYLCI